MIIGLVLFFVATPIAVFNYLQTGNPLRFKW